MIEAAQKSFMVIDLTLDRGSCSIPSAALQTPLTKGNTMTKRQLKREVARLTAELDAANHNHAWCDYRITRLTKVINRLSPGWSERDAASDRSRADFVPNLTDYTVAR